MMVFINNVKLHLSVYSGHLQVLTTFLLYDVHKPRGDVEISSLSLRALDDDDDDDDDDDEISTSPRGLGILYITLIARKLSKPEDGRYRPKLVVFHC